MRIKLTSCLQMIVAMIATLCLVACQNEPDNRPDNGPDDDNTPTVFSFENVRADHTSITVNVVPEDKDMEYIVFVAELKHFAANRIDTPEKLFEDDYLYFSEYATEYKMDMHEFLSLAGWLVKGDKRDYSAVNLYPDTDYVIYCYGVEFEDENHYTATTDIDHKVIRTTAPEITNTTFDITTEVSGNYVTIDITPNNYDGLYYYYVVDDSDLFFVHKGMEFSDEYLAHYRNKAFKEFNLKINSEGYAPDSFCYKGKSSVSKRYNADTNYMVLCFSVSDEQTPLLNSKPTIAYFSTGEIELTDLTFDIQVSNITPYNAILSIEPSKDVPYACVFLSMDQMPEAEDELEVMNIIIDYYQPAILEGKHEQKLTPLMPGSEYIVAAFSIEDMMPTSHLATYTFTSLEADKGTISIESINLLKLYDAEEILAIDSSLEEFIGETECIAIVEAKTSTPADKLLFWWFEEWHKVEYTDEAFLEDLLMYDYADNPEIMQMYYSVDNNNKFLFAGIVEDKDGNFSDIYYGDTFLLTEDMTSPAEEFFDWLKSSR